MSSVVFPSSEYCLDSALHLAIEPSLDAESSRGFGCSQKLDAPAEASSSAGKLEQRAKTVPFGYDEDFDFDQFPQIGESENIGLNNPSDIISQHSAEAILNLNIPSDIFLTTFLNNGS